MRLAGDINHQDTCLVPGRRGYGRGTSDEFVAFVEYYRLRLTDDPHLWAVTPYDEVRELCDLGGCDGRPSSTVVIRKSGTRPSISTPPG